MYEKLIRELDSLSALGSLSSFPAPRVWVPADPAIPGISPQSWVCSLAWHCSFPS